jgi:hypothetical protein
MGEGPPRAWLALPPLRLLTGQVQEIDNCDENIEDDSQAARPIKKAGDRAQQVAEDVPGPGWPVMSRTT